LQLDCLAFEKQNEKKREKRRKGTTTGEVLTKKTTGRQGPGDRYCIKKKKTILRLDSHEEGLEREYLHKRGGKSLLKK
jgi:hypothetical protein